MFRRFGDEKPVIDTEEIVDFVGGLDDLEHRLEIGRRLKAEDAILYVL